MSPASRIASIFERVGRPATLRRVETAFPGDPWSPVESATDHAVSVVVRGYQPRDVHSSIAEGDREVRMAAFNAPAIPAVDDRLLLDGEEHAVLAVETREIAGEAIFYIMQVRG